MKIQEVYARQVLEEEGLNLKIEIEHKEKPKTIIGEKVFSLIFPKRLFKETEEKTIDKIFIGKLEGRGKFISKFPNSYVIESLRGRDTKLKGKDETYFDLMRKSKFALCPNGDFIWTYRFFEAIICKAIPIIEDFSEMYEGYIFYREGDKFVYDEKIVEFNLNKLKKEMTYG